MYFIIAYNIHKHSLRADTYTACDNTPVWNMVTCGRGTEVYTIYVWDYIVTSLLTANNNITLLIANMLYYQK